ncbi:MAG: adenylate/guanylate cyclase domain-containing protein, partial [Spirochaetota bacterium]
LRHHSAIIGLTATGTQDIGVTPLSSHYMMVGTYPNVLNTILQKEFITEASGMANYIVMLLIALLSGFVIQKLNAKQSVITIIASGFGFYAVILLVFSIMNLWFDQLGILLSILLPSLTIASVKFLKEESQRRFIKSAFGHYISPRVIDEIIKNPETLNLGGEMRQITTFFSDVAKFSTISEQLTPPELVLLLNEYLSEMTDIILKNDGTIDKYEGDAIMAFYGAPHFLEDHALRACHGAMEMQKRLADMREVWKKQGKHELYVRMGLNTGDAVVGNMGSRTRMDYTAMGDSVNLASRLEGANKHYGTYLMISEDTHMLVKDDFGYRELDTIRVVGKEKPIKVFELMDTWGNLSDQMLEMRSKYNEGLKLFKERDWKKARAAFRAALKIIPEDGPSNTYDARCTEFIQTPPSKNWDGVYRLRSK